MKYARWKTADIIKAINEGRTPQAGPPASMDEDEDAEMQDFEGDGSRSTQDFGFPAAAGDVRDGLPGGSVFGRVSPADGPAPAASLPPPPEFPSFPDPPSRRPDSAAGRMPPTQPEAPSESRPSAAASTDYSAPRSSASGGTYTYDPKVLTNAQKHARFAISAIQYDDIETAVDNLKKALKYLEPYQKK
jgi:vacuolar protein sorting-associated protein VTA1